VSCQNTYWAAVGGMSFFESVEYPAYNGITTAPHSLGAIPKFVHVILRCKVADVSYAAGDEVDVTGNGFYNWFNYMSSANASTITTILEGTIYVPRKDTGSLNSGAITPANWRLVFRAWR
jgi:hypothetical protein